MSKTFLYRLFGIGKIPQKEFTNLKNEGILLQEEGISGTVILTNFRAPGKYFSKKLSWFSGSIVLTHQHILAFRFSKIMIGLSWNEPLLKQLNCYIDDKSRFCITYDASVFDDKCSGNIELRYSSDQSDKLLKIITEKLA
ncbi:MAG: hypothetical protein HON94_09680 [Methylococcales bacterium]|jgi:hypothetical protein|nr:hypothetical protein [Methylococcales bacterium]MBT7409611.1 hypothetical protein [Methylococcales bacterium]